MQDDYEINGFLMARRVPGLIQDGQGPGAYLIKNKASGEVYIGQSVNPIERVVAHFSGRGNGDVYADYKYGAPFTVRFYDLAGSGFRDLNELEFHLIRIYQSDMNGYNRRAGNATRGMN